jgi:diacylglycerol kinase family enzyme
VIVILNRAAGTAATHGDECAVLVRDLFAEHGVEVDIRQPDPQSDVLALARAAAQSPEEVVVAGGGDGTISAVASILAGNRDKVLGVLPLGTLNHFAKDLGIPLDLAEAVETIVRGEMAEIDAAEVNGRVFINNSSLGIYPHLVTNRRAQHERLGRRTWPAFFWAVLQTLQRFPFLRLRVTAGGRRLARHTAFLFVGNNEYEIAGFKIGGRACLNAGKLGLYLTHRTGRFGFFRLGLRALLGRLNQADDFESFCVDEAMIEARRSRLLVAIDGEVESMKMPLHYRARPRALRVRVPGPNKAE